jgi:citrate lyase subunit beta / citryl-CoA lyase
MSIGRRSYCFLDKCKCKNNFFSSSQQPYRSLLTASKSTKNNNGIDKHFLNRPRRSVLYMPGSNKRALEKAQNLSADSLIFDLEDAVAPSAKDEARENVFKAANSNKYGKREIIVRVNSLNSSWGIDDVILMSKSNAHSLLLPKVESPSDIYQLERLMESNGAREEMGIGCMIETPLGVFNAYDIATASPKIHSLMLGTTDLAQELRAKHTEDRGPFLTSLSLCVLAARAANIAVLDGVHLDLQNDEEFEQHCIQGREYGFDGKTLIHPKQIENANKIFGPTEEDVAFSKRVIQAFKVATEEGKGAITLDNRLVEHMHVTEAYRVLHQHEMIENLME